MERILRMVGALVVLAGVVLGTSAAYTVTDTGWTISVALRVMPADAEPGASYLLESVPVPAGLQGVTCRATGSSTNDESVHVQSYLELQSATVVQVLGTEDGNAGVHLVDNQITLGDSIEVWYFTPGRSLGEQPLGVSVAATFVLTCPTGSTTTTSTTTTTLPSTTTTTVPDSTTTTVPGSTTTTVPGSTTTTVPEASLEVVDTCYLVTVTNTGSQPVQVRWNTSNGADVYRQLPAGEQWQHTLVELTGVDWRVEQGIWVDGGPDFTGWVYQVVDQGTVPVCDDTPTTTTTVPPVTTPTPTLPFTGPPVEAGGLLLLAGAALLLLGGGLLLAGRPV